MKLNSTNMQKPRSFEKRFFLISWSSFCETENFQSFSRKPWRTLENAGMRNMDPNSPISPSYSNLNQIIDLPWVKSRSFKLLELSILNPGNRLIKLRFSDKT